MPKLKQYNIFISHPWTSDDEFSRLKSNLKAYPSFKTNDYSIPKSNPLDVSTNDELETALDEQIRHASVVLILAGMYVKHRKWIQKEIEIAQKYGKHIIGIKPWGQERLPSEVVNASTTMVGWNTSSIVNAIRNYYL